MAMPAYPTEWTVDMVRALPDDGNRYEVIDGELFVTPAPSWTHQRAVLEMATLIRPYIHEHGLGDLIIAPADVVFGPRNAVEPDLFVVPLVEGVVPRVWEEVGRLLLTVEVLSPSTSRTDRREKRDLYQSKAVPDYWIVDVASAAVERWTPDDSAAQVLTETLEWQPDRFLPPLRIDLPAYFARVLGAR
jgi:Uma2 family endonuclease